MFKTFKDAAKFLKKKFNYRKVKNPIYNCECCYHCKNRIELSPYMSRCHIIAWHGYNDEKCFSVAIYNVCDKFDRLL
jgi:hypothetical protein